MTKNTDPLDQLAAQAEASLSNPPLGQGVTDLDTAGPQDPPALTNEQALGGALAAGREAFCAFTRLQSPRTTLDDKAVQTLAELWGPVLTKYGINVGALVEDYALELAAVIGSFGIAAAVRSGVMAEIADRKAKEEKPTTDGDGATQG